MQESFPKSLEEKMFIIGVGNIDIFLSQYIEKKRD